MSLPRPSIVDLVFEPVDDGKPLPSRAALIVVAVVVHLALMAWAISLEPGLGPWSHALTARIHADLSRVQMIESPPVPTKIKPPPPDVPPVDNSPIETPPPAQPPTKARQPARPRAKPGPPAQASQVVARQPDGRVDMTENVFVTGNAQRYAGGASSANGTAKGKGLGTGGGSGGKQDVSTPKPPVRHTGPDRTTTVHLESRNWECPWPTAAVDEPIDEQLAVIRVTVEKTGSVVAATLLEDPGHGFGSAALKCAKNTRFEPATNRAGQPIRAQSPPIRVWFSR